ncbi:MAG: adenylate/guanylate cyclase domain-containing protein [Treponema sp.]|nr:adenylate/guanylate cyclase domain-containing protein [Treponema sp.]
MNTKNITKTIIQSLFLIVLFISPFAIDKINLLSAETNVTLLFPYKIAFENPVFFVFYLLPVFSIFLIVSIFLKKDFSKLSSLLFFLGLTIYIIFCVTITIFNATTVRWFLSIPWYIYLNFAISIITHSTIAIIELKRIRKNNPNYLEYKTIRESEKSAIKAYKQQQLQQIKKDKKANKKNKKEKKFYKVQISLKTKVIFSVMGTITIILLTFLIFILRSYKINMTESVSNIGCAQAEQTASVYDSADGLYEKIQHFFETQKESNSFTNAPYERIDIIITDSKESFYLEEISDSTQLPEYQIFAYTTGKPSQINAEDKSISSVNALEYVKRFKNGSYRKSPIYNKTTREYKFYHPVSFGRKSGRKLVGFSVVTYKQELLMKQYFQTKVFAITMSILFLYFCFFITLFLSDTMINPLLYLRTNVRKTSNSIKDILSGSAKINQEDFEYEDCIKTNDEIKDLSVEIGNLVSLIRGIVPYISFSTLKNAEKDSKKSTSRELCFLFTDIRGFTSLCEGLPPKDVVNILNHYLDIETQIILNNGGDVDKFVGDEMMAFFAGPKKEFNACKAAMEIRAAMREEQEKSKNDESTFVSIGIGINTGKVVFGPIGSSTRMDFTSIGDTVNLAARLESANKVYGSKSIITEAVFAKLHDKFICRELDFITVKGKTEPVRIYEILQEKNKAEDKIFEIKNLFEQGLELYRQQKWKEAFKLFDLNARKYHDYPSIVFIDRIRHFAKNPPPKDWDGVFVMKTK